MDGNNQPIIGIIKIDPSKGRGILLDIGGFNPNNYPIWLPAGEHIEIPNEEHGFGLAHICVGHSNEGGTKDFENFGTWLGKDLKSYDEIAEFIYETITTQKGVAVNDWGTVIYAFRDRHGNMKFLTIAINPDTGIRSDYVGRIHTAFPITYENKHARYEELFGPNGPYSDLVKII